jgi:hypothetical protein
MLTRILLLWFVFVSTAYSEARLCLPQICIGDDPTIVPIAWAAATEIQFMANRYKESLNAMSNSEWAIARENIFSGNGYRISASPDIEKKIFLYFNDRKFDKQALKLIKSVRSVCMPITLNGSYKTKSGYVTEVSIQAAPDNKKGYSLKIDKIYRVYDIAGGMNPDEALKISKKFIESLQSEISELEVIEVDGRMDFMDDATREYVKTKKGALLVVAFYRNDPDKFDIVGRSIHMELTLRSPMYNESIQSSEQLPNGCETAPAQIE